MNIGDGAGSLLHTSRMDRFADDLSILQQTAHVQSVAYFLCQQQEALPFSLASLNSAISIHVTRASSRPNYLVIPTASGWLDSETSMPNEIIRAISFETPVSASYPSRPLRLGKIFGLSILTDMGTTLVKASRYRCRFSYPCLVCVDSKNQVTDIAAIFNLRSRKEGK